MFFSSVFLPSAKMNCTNLYTRIQREKKNSQNRNRMFRMFWNERIKYFLYVFASVSIKASIKNASFFYDIHTYILSQPIYLFSAFLTAAKMDSPINSADDLSSQTKIKVKYHSCNILLLYPTNKVLKGRGEEYMAVSYSLKRWCRGLPNLFFPKPPLFIPIRPPPPPPPPPYLYKQKTTIKK